MDLRTLAQAVEDKQLRASLKDGMSAEEASAFEAYASEYESNELVFNKGN